jgi:ATP-dependent DNA helicase RecQ
VLLFNHADVYTQERLIQSNHPPESVMSDVWNALRAEGEFDRGLNTLALQVGASEFEVSAAVRILEREGCLSRSNRGEGPWQITVEERASKAHPHSDDAKVLLAALRDGYPQGRPFTTELAVLGRRTKLSEDEVRHGLSLLEKAGVVQVKRPFGGRAIRAVKDVPFSELELDLDRVREQERRSLLLLKRMTEYAYTKRCRRAYILQYFGETLEEACSGCDVCSGHRVEAKTASRPTAAAEARVSHVAPGSHSELALSELKAWRRELSRSLEVPPYIVFNDATLLAIATALPITREEFLRVKGTGESRWEKFGVKVREICLVARAAGHAPAPAPLKVRRRRAAG